MFGGMFWRSDLVAVAQAGNSSDADPVARWLAILGQVVTVISLLWQIIAFAWSGSRKVHSGTFSKLDDAPWPTPGWRSAPSPRRPTPFGSGR
jgi:hypothetical protein